MTKFASDEILFFRPNSPNSDGVVNVVYAYPNEYSIGICSLGYQIVWALLNTISNVSVTRLFTDAMESIPRSTDIDLLGFSLSWELDYVGLFDQFKFLDIPRRAKNRTSMHPLIFGGGPVLTANPEPFSDFFDIILLGDGENTLPAFVRSYSKNRHLPREELLFELSKIDGVYIPELYDVKYESKVGPINSISPANDGVEQTITKATYRGKKLATSTVVSPIMAWENIFMVEAVRSCPERCAFCLASYVTLPFRAASITDELIPSIENAFKKTDRIGLLGASVTQHPQFDALLDELTTDKYDGMRLSISSVRTNTVKEKMVKALVKRGTKSLTIAIESGSERLRGIINKKLNNSEIIEAAKVAQDNGLSSLKLYGMAGLPGEIPEDHLETIEMFDNMRKAAPKLRLSFGCSTFVPKAHTPFQYFGVRKDAEKQLKLLGKAMGKRGVAFRPESYKWSVIQALISRGDRRISAILELVSEYGDTLGCFRRAFKELRGELPPLEYYVFEDWPISAVLPWTHIRTSISPEKILDARRDAEQLFREDSPEYARVEML